MPDSRDQPAKRTTPDQAQREDRSTGGRWAVVVDGHEAEMTYSRASPTLIIIDHTEVPDALRGQARTARLAIGGYFHGIRPALPGVSCAYRTMECNRCE